MARDALKSRLRQERKDGRLISADDIGELKRADLRVKVRLVRPRDTLPSAFPPRSCADRSLSLGRFTLLACVPLLPCCLHMPRVCARTPSPHFPTHTPTHTLVGTREASAHLHAGPGYRARVRLSAAGARVVRRALRPTRLGGGTRAHREAVPQPHCRVAGAPEPYSLGGIFTRSPGACSHPFSTCILRPPHIHGFTPPYVRPSAGGGHVALALY